jgi:hypothetical protein
VLTSVIADLTNTKITKFMSGIPFFVSYYYVTRVMLFISKNYVTCWPDMCDVWQNVVMLTNDTTQEL